MTLHPIPNSQRSRDRYRRRVESSTLRLQPSRAGTVVSLSWTACATATAAFAWQASGLSRGALAILVAIICVAGVRCGVRLAGKRALRELRWTDRGDWRLVDSSNSVMPARLASGTRRLGGRFIWLVFRTRQGTRAALVDRRAVGEAGFVRLAWQLQREARRPAGFGAHRPADGSC